MLGLKAYSRIGDIPGQVDLAIVAIPAAQAVHVARSAARPVSTPSWSPAPASRRPVRTASCSRTSCDAGPASGDAGRRPSSFGVINNDPAVRLNASLSPTLPSPGPLGLFSQSGALGIAILASAARRGLGLSIFANSGNRADVSGNDLMQYWIDDPRTSVVGLYLSRWATRAVLPRRASPRDDQASHRRQVRAQRV